MFEEDDKEVEQIIGRVISYFIKMGFDDVSLATKDLTNTTKYLSEILIESEHITQLRNAGKQMDIEAGVFNSMIMESLK